ncbi:MAG: hypothetical protein ACYDCS_14960 [Candidatus Dormibacteria bacterium]
MAKHALQAPGGASIDDRHYPTPPAHRDACARSDDRHRTRIPDPGSVAEAYCAPPRPRGATRLPRLLDDVLVFMRSHGRDTAVAWQR